MSYTPRHEPDHEETGYPPGVPYIIGNEGCERFSFYGMKAILYIYIVGLFLQLNGMAYDDARSSATAATHLFVAGVYCVPLIGGIIADRLLGKYRTIMYLSVVYCLGHLALAVFENATWQQEMFGQVYIDPLQGLFIGLLLICLGSGGIKPCVSAHVGDQFGKKNWYLLQNIFNAFYFIINFGSTFSTLIIPKIRGSEIWMVGGQSLPLRELQAATSMTVDQIQHAGQFMGYDGSVGLAFGVPGILMGLATIAFWMGRKVFIHVQPSPGGKLGLLDTMSGTSLFMVFAYPVWFAEIAGTGAGGTVAICAAFFIGFVALFSVRQRIEQDDGFVAIMFHAVTSTLSGRGGRADVPEGADDVQRRIAESGFWGSSVTKFGMEATEGPVAVIKIVSVFLMVSVFWALFDQHSSTWIEQAKSMDRLMAYSLYGWLGLGATLGVIVAGALVLSVGRTPSGRALGVVAGLGIGVLLGYLAHVYMPDGGYNILASQVPSTNPILVMILIPYTNFGLYPLLRKLGWDPTALRRMTLGMFMAGLSFVAVALIQRQIDGGAKVHVAWQMIPYAIITLSEVMVSITGLEFAYSQAPKRMKSVVMGFWLLMVTIGSLLVVFLAGFKDLSPENFFWVFAGLMSLAAAVFGLRTYFYETKDYTQ